MRVQPGLLMEIKKMQTGQQRSQGQPVAVAVGEHFNATVVSIQGKTVTLNMDGHLVHALLLADESPSQGQPLTLEVVSQSGSETTLRMVQAHQGIDQAHVHDMLSEQLAHIGQRPTEENSMILKTMHGFDLPLDKETFQVIKQTLFYMKQVQETVAKEGLQTQAKAITIETTPKDLVLLNEGTKTLKGTNQEPPLTNTTGHADSLASTRIKTEVLGFSQVNGQLSAFDQKGLGASPGNQATDALPPQADHSSLIQGSKVLDPQPLGLEAESAMKESGTPSIQSEGTMNLPNTSGALVKDPPLVSDQGAPNISLTKTDPVVTSQVVQEDISLQETVLTRLANLGQNLNQILDTVGFMTKQNIPLTLVNMVLVADFLQNDLGFFEALSQMAKVNAHAIDSTLNQTTEGLLQNIKLWDQLAEKEDVSFFKTMIREAETLSTIIKESQQTASARSLNQMDLVKQTQSLLSEFSSSWHAFYVPIQVQKQLRDIEIYIKTDEHKKNQLNPDDALIYISLDTHQLKRVRVKIQFKKDQIQVDIITEKEVYATWIQSQLKDFETHLADTSKRKMILSCYASDAEVSLASLEKLEIFHAGKIDFKV